MDCAYYREDIADMNVNPVSKLRELMKKKYGIEAYLGAFGVIAPHVGLGIILILLFLTLECFRVM